MKGFLFSLAGLAATLAYAATARADLQVYLSDGQGDSVLYTAHTPGTVSGVVTGTGTSGSATYGLVNGQWQLTVIGGTLGTDSATTSEMTFGLTSDMSNSPGSNGLAQLQSTTFSIGNAGTVALNAHATFSGNDFAASNFAGQTFIKTFESLTNLTDPGKVTGTSYIDSGNHLMTTTGIGYAMPQLSATGAGSGDHSSDSSVSVSFLGTTFSLGQVISAPVAAGTNVSMEMNTQVTPEPASLLAWTCGLGLVGLVRRRRRAATA